MAAQKKYVCAFCARAFTRSEHKQRHERSHTNEKPFHCSYCTSAFVRRDLLQRHCRTVHNIKLASRAKEKRALSEGSIKKDQLQSQNGAQSAIPLVNGNIPPANTASTERPFHAPPLAPALAAFPPPNVETSSSDGSVHRSPNGNTQRPQVLPGPQHTPQMSHVPHDPMLSPNSCAPLASLRLLQASVAQDPLHLLSSSKNVSKILDSNDLKYPVNDMFLVGNAVLSSERHSLFPSLLASLVESLRFPPSGSSVYDLRMGQVYSILAVGALSSPSKDYDSEELATAFINKSWNIIVDTLNSAHSSLHAQCDVLKSLYLLTYIYLRFFNNDLMVSYLEDSAHIILQNLSAPPAQNELISSNLELFWSTYVLVSKYKSNEAPPKFYSWFLAARLHNSSPITLAQATRSFSKQTFMLEDPFLLEVIICTLANEVNNLYFHKTLWIFDSPRSLHDAIIFVNKAMVMSARSPALEGTAIFHVFRTKLTLASSPAFEELLQAHIFRISVPHHWNLLLLTLREFNAPFSFNNFMRENLTSSFQSFGNSLLNFFTFESQSMSASTDLHVNLGIVSIPLIFQYNFLRLNNTEPPFNPKDLSIVDLANLNNLILEWYITVVKVLVNLITRHSPAEAEEFVRNNNVLSCMFYMINSNCASTPTFASTEFYLQVFDGLTKVCDTWFNFINQGVNLRTLRMNLNRFLNDLVVLALNNENISIADLYVANESILIKNRRSKSIGSVDMNGQHSSRSSLSSGFPPPAMASNRGGSNNYVLMNKSENETGSPQSFYQVSPTSSLAPLQGVTKLNFSSPAGPRVQKPMPHPMNSPPVPASSTYVLPPIYAAVKDHGKPGEMK